MAPLWTRRLPVHSIYFLKVSYSWIYLGLQPLHHNLCALLYFRTEFPQSTCNQNSNSHWPSSLMREAENWEARSAWSAQVTEPWSRWRLLLPHPKAWFFGCQLFSSARQSQYHWGKDRKYGMKIPTEMALTGGQNSLPGAAIKKEVGEILQGRDREHALRRTLCFLSINRIKFNENRANWAKLGLPTV